MTIEDLRNNCSLRGERHYGYCFALNDVQKEIIKKVKECEGSTIIWGGCGDYESFGCDSKHRCDACKALMEFGSVTEEML